MLNNDTRSIQLKKSTTMDFKNPPQSTLDSSAKPLPRRSASFASTRSTQSEFPTSPQLFLGDKIFHSNHPKHHLVEVDSPYLFKCGGCKEYGSGKRLSCQQCDFHLHRFCAFAPLSLLGHPFHIHHQLVFQTKPGGIRKSKCDACSKTIKGYNFRCGACSFEIHPCCAKLSNEMNFSSLHQHTLKILPVTPSTNNGDQPGFVCCECRRKRSGRVYRCSVAACDYHLHVVCAKDMVNGLHANNIKHVDKPNRLGAAARAAQQVFVDFLGGLIEGIGETVGEAIVTNMTRGRNNNNANS
ncbi:uncharacterized protein LOC123203054 [Mangifera indica]|uniref:uncharacterized protein LOC123203054 n=1 Tax=Mangifera indica TaxID=29780 RepID=UPI001CFBE9A6|nr:uncharacterized protein LOC123203054 [Mangifera indica]